MTEQPPPPGFEPYERPSPLLDPWRPLWVQELTDRTIMGVRVREAHCNSRGTVHGGFYAALADQATGLTCSHQILAAGLPLQQILTTSLTIDYLAGAKVGQWLTFDTHFNKGNRSTWYAEIDICADGQTVARGHATFRVKLNEDPK